jgi:hypothetical protein
MYLISEETRTEHQGFSGIMLTLVDRYRNYRDLPRKCGLRKPDMGTIRIPGNVANYERFVGELGGKVQYFSFTSS